MNPQTLKNMAGFATMALSNHWKQVDHYGLGSSSKTNHVDAQNGATETVLAQNGKCLAMQDVTAQAQCSRTQYLV